MVEAISGRILQAFAIHDGHAAPGPHQAIEVRLASGGRGGGAFRANGATVLQPGLDDPPFFLVQLGPDRLFADFRNQAVVAVQRLFHLHHIVGLHLGRRVDGGQAAADHDRGKPELQVRQAIRLVSAGGLKTHEKIGSQAHAAQQVVFHGHQGRLAGAGADGHVVEPQVPGVVQRQGAAEADAVVQAELLAPHQQQVIDVQEVLVPAHGDAVFGDAAEAEDDAAIQRPGDVVDVLDRLGHAPLGPAHAHGKRFDAQPVDADHAEAFVQQVVGQRVARRPHADHENVLAVVRKGIGPAEIERVPAGQQRVDFEAVGQMQHIGQDAGFDLGNVHRRLLLVDARLHAVVANAVAGAGAQGIVHHDHGQRPDAVAFALQQVRFGNLLLQRTARQFDSQGVFLGRAVFLRAAPWNRNPCRGDDR